MEMKNLELFLFNLNPMEQPFFVFEKDTAGGSDKKMQMHDTSPLKWLPIGNLVDTTFGCSNVLGTVLWADDAQESVADGFVLDGEMNLLHLTCEGTNNSMRVDKNMRARTHTHTQHT